MTTLHKYISGLLALSLLTFGVSCERELDELEPATFPTTADVFIDGFSGGLNYDAFGGSDVTAFEVDMEVKYQGTSSMRISVPDAEDPAGAYAGGAYSTDVGRDLSGYTALTFWAKASKAANVDVFGIGNDLGANRYIATINDVPLTTNWQKYYIPIPDPSKLTQERGMFYYSEGPEDGRGYTFWIDEVKFENLSTIVLTEAGIYNGEDRQIVAETGNTIFPDGYAVFNLPDGTNQRMSAASAYFDYTSSNPSVATPSADGGISVLDTGEAMVTATLQDREAEGSLILTSTGEAVLPETAAPTPDEAAENVISLYSNAYNDVPVDFYNGFWEFSTTQSEEIRINGDDIIRYTQLNFVGIQFTSPTIDISDMTHLHIDIWTPNPTTAPAEFKVEVVDLGPDGTFGGEDNAAGVAIFTAPTLRTGSWVSLDIPLSSLPSLVTRTQLAQVVLSSVNIPTLFMDNLYFYDDGSGGGGGGDEPAQAAPAPPARNAADVISLFSDAYDDVPVDTWRTEWSMATFQDVMIAGNATKKYSALDFVGIETVLNQLDISDMTHFHIDVWSPDFTSFRTVLVDFGADGGFEGGDDSEQTVQFTTPPRSQWNSYDIALSDLTELTGRNNFAQLILGAMPAGGATVFIDNIYFYKEDNGGGGGDEPTEAAPTPTLPAANVISLFSDAYDDVPVDTWRTDWSPPALVFEDVMIAGNPTKKYTNLDFVGIETVMNQVDITGMTHFHIDVWSPNFESFRFVLVDFGPDGDFQGGDDTEATYPITGPAQGEWISLDIPLSELSSFTGRENFAQLILGAGPPGAPTVYVDNIYFHN